MMVRARLLGHSHDRGGRPLDPNAPTPNPERPASDPAQASGDAGAAGGSGASAGAGASSAGTSAGAGTGPKAGASAKDEPPGLIAQLKATNDAVLGVLRAHIALGKAEAEVIKGEVAHAAAFAGIAVAALVLLGIFLPIVTMLFLGEWLFGSIGWGVLLGSEMLLAIAATSVVLALKLDGVIQPAAAVGVIAGVVAFFVAGGSWFNRLWTLIGDNTNIAIDSAYRPLAIAIVVVAVIGAVIGFLAGAKAAGIGGAIAGLVAGLVVGGLLGGFLAYDFGWRVGAAIGFAVAYAAYLGMLAARAAAVGVDVEKIKLRFWPQQTIDTTMETIEWAKARNPLGPKS